MGIASARQHTDAVVAALAATNLPVGDGEKPPGNPPYLVVYGGSETTSGTLAAPNDDSDPITQVTYVGISREQADGARDRGRAVILGGTLTIPGRAVRETPTLEVGRPVQRDDDVSPPLFYAIDLYRIPTSPA